MPKHNKKVLVFNPKKTNFDIYPLALPPYTYTLFIYNALLCNSLVPYLYPTHSVSIPYQYYIWYTQLMPKHGQNSNKSKIINAYSMDIYAHNYFIAFD